MSGLFLNFRLVLFYICFAYVTSKCFGDPKYHRHSFSRDSGYDLPRRSGKDDDFRHDRFPERHGPSRHVRPISWHDSKEESRDEGKQTPELAEDIYMRRPTVPKFSYLPDVDEFVSMGQTEHNDMSSAADKSFREFLKRLEDRKEPQKAVPVFPDDSKSLNDRNGLFKNGEKLTDRGKQESSKATKKLDNLNRKMLDESDNGKQFSLSRGEKQRNADTKNDLLNKKWFDEMDNSGLHSGQIDLDKKLVKRAGEKQGKPGKHSSRGLHKIEPNLDSDFVSKSKEMLDSVPKDSDFSMLDPKQDRSRKQIGNKPEAQESNSNGGKSNNKKFVKSGKNPWVDFRLFVGDSGALNIELAPPRNPKSFSESKSPRAGFTHRDHADEHPSDWHNDAVFDSSDLNRKMESSGPLRNHKLRRDVGKSEKTDDNEDRELEYDLEHRIDDMKDIKREGKLLFHPMLEDHMETAEDAARQTAILKLAPIPFTINVDDQQNSGCPALSCSNKCSGELRKLSPTTGCPMCACCPVIRCDVTCEFGYEADMYGCPRCECLKN